MTTTYDGADTRDRSTSEDSTMTDMAQGRARKALGTATTHIGVYAGSAKDTVVGAAKKHGPKVTKRVRTAAQNPTVRKVAGHRATKRVGLGAVVLSVLVIVRRSRRGKRG